MLRRRGGAPPGSFGCCGNAGCHGEMLETRILRDVSVSVGVPLRTQTCRQSSDSTFTFHSDLKFGHNLFLGPFPDQQQDLYYLLISTNRTIIMQKALLDVEVNNLHILQTYRT